MPPLPVELLVPMFGVILGLLVFAGLLQLGMGIVRLLKLPNDLPEGPHFEPPPPASRALLDRAEAVSIAARQVRLRQLFARARAAAQAVQICTELAAHTYPATTGAPDPATATADLTRCAATALAAAETADRAVRSPDAIAAASVIEEQAAIAETAAREAQALVAKYPSGRDRRLRLMLIILVVLVVWMVMMHLLMPKLH